MLTWDELSDLDKGAALLHLHKISRDGRRYAVDHYPAQYFDHPELVVLDAEQASSHAYTLRGHTRSLSDEEYDRLYDIALDADIARGDPYRRTLSHLGGPAAATDEEG